MIFCLLHRSIYIMISINFKLYPKQNVHARQEKNVISLLWLFFTTKNVQCTYLHEERIQFNNFQKFNSDNIWFNKSDWIWVRVKKKTWNYKDYETCVWGMWWLTEEKKCMFFMMRKKKHKDKTDKMKKSYKCCVFVGMMLLRYTSKHFENI